VRDRYTRWARAWGDSPCHKTTGTGSVANTAAAGPSTASGAADGSRQKENLNKRSSRNRSARLGCTMLPLYSPSAGQLWSSAAQLCPVLPLASPPPLHWPRCLQSRRRLKSAEPEEDKERRRHVWREICPQNSRQGTGMPLRRSSTSHLLPWRTARGRRYRLACAWTSGACQSATRFKHRSVAGRPSSRPAMPHVFAANAASRPHKAPGLVVARQSTRTGQTWKSPHRSLCEERRWVCLSIAARSKPRMRKLWPRVRPEGIRLCWPVLQPPTS
jgi:hypothetical protein